jgi:hypothetical protein
MIDERIRRVLVVSVGGEHRKDSSGQIRPCEQSIV